MFLRTKGDYMARQDGPMPLGDLPEYMKSVRDVGQGDHIPVVDIGRIVDDRPRRGRLVAFAVAACLFVGLAGMYAVNSTSEISISSSSNPVEVSKMVSEEGGKVFSVRKEDDGTYKVRVFDFGGARDLVNRLKNNRQFDSVEMKD
jgi:hypothetical protein